VNVVGHILIIDDEAPLRQTLARILQRAGHQVTTAESGEMALSMLSNTPFDLVYMDIRMPGMPGLEALKIVHSSQPDLPVVLFTAQPDLHSAVEALRLGATDYLLKPLQPHILIERTSTILAHQQKQRRKREIQLQIQTLQAELKSLEDGDVGPATPLPEVSGERFLSRGRLTMDLLARRVTLAGQIVNLPPTAFDYLLVLARHSPNMVDYQTLAAEAQGYAVEMREAQELVKWHIHHIRQAIEADEQSPALIVNVRGSGYRLVAD
jgi:DNA-binding response OmpR family regulator